jgi:hypothetical protein
MMVKQRVKEKMLHEPRVVLRIRVVKAKAPQGTIISNVTIACGGSFSQLPVSTIEWAVFEISSIREKVSFQCLGTNVNYVCGDFEGRKRVDFTSKVSVLFEGYWWPLASRSTTSTPKSVVTSKITDHCQVFFMPTQGGDEYQLRGKDDILIAPSWLNEPRAETNHRIQSLNDGPVSIALGWLTDSPFVDSKVEVPKNRIRYHPGVKENRLIWTYDLTAMNDDLQTAINKPKLYL